MNYNDMKCFLGLHDLEIYKEEKLLDVRDSLIGKVIICRCKTCGKIKYYKVYTTESNSRY